MRNFPAFAVLFFGSWILSSQENPQYQLETNYFYGNIAAHSPNISHLITGHPEGILLHFGKKTYGYEAWERRYNYPEVGFSMSYQDLKNRYLGENYGLYAHLGFYLLDRHLLIRAGQGLALTTNAYDPDENFRNSAYGSRILSSTFLSGNLQFPEIYGGLGFQVGFSLVHYSNADFKSPNSSTNTVAVSAGLNYLFNHQAEVKFVQKEEEDLADQAFRCNLIFRSGVNTTGLIGSKAYPFYTFSGLVDRQLGYKSTLQAGAELFLSEALEEYIYYRSLAFPEEGRSGDEDSKRAGVFLGHQLTFKKLSLITHLGYYIYYPYEDYVGRVYNRIGLQRPVYKDLYGSVSVRSHGTNAEAVELSLGYKF